MIIISYLYGGSGWV